MAGRGADEGRRKPPGSGELIAARVRARKNGPGDRKAAMERREAPAFSKRERGKTEDWCAARCSIPSAFCREEKKEDGVPRAVKEQGQ